MGADPSGLAPGGPSGLGPIFDYFQADRDALAQAEHEIKALEGQVEEFIVEKIPHPLPPEPDWVDTAGAEFLQASPQIGLGILTEGFSVEGEIFGIDAGEIVENSGRINPWDISFTQDTVSWEFTDPQYNIGDSAYALREGHITDLRAAELFEKDGQIYSLDNRRVVTYRSAGLSMPYKKARPSTVRHLLRKGRMTTKNRGSSVVINMP